jgi:transcriptional regulator with XRE-family HTH domain
MEKTKDEVETFFDNLSDNDESYREFKKTWGALASFLTDYEHLKGLNNLTQEDIAKKSGTTQSAISRLECMKGKPTYELLRRLSDAVGGSLFITPLAEFTITLPYDLHDTALSRSKEEGLSIPELLEDLLRNDLESPKYSNVVFGKFQLTLPQEGANSPSYGAKDSVENFINMKGATPKTGLAS